jgi:ferric-dicitrate binding protein FerR (iron transport regulator)
VNGRLLRIEDGSGLMVEVQQGSVWLTQEGDAADVYLGPGQRFRLDRDGVALAQALTPNTTFTVAR